ncbi:glycoside hydrolase family 30 protein [Limibacter armeniacum]|uniref:glycoside hydrolase family 30 protein n=1 Tax=Limibacter armeniacum TaxID=466084 RepID=UPI002FE599F2
MKRYISIGLLALTTAACQPAEAPQEAKSEAKKNVPVNSKTVSVYTTAKDTDLKISKGEELVFGAYKQPVETEHFIYLDTAHHFQKFVGIGGAVTDASAEVFATLSEEKQQDFLKAYYDQENGIGYSLMRTTIHSADFGPGSYTYVADNDDELKTFNIEHDEKYRIPLIKKAMETAGQMLPLYASPWSPPAWMKDNNNMLKGGKLLPEFRQTWADYYVKFIQAYEAKGLPIWGLTVQNEPMAVQRWESCVYTAEDERDFVKNYLGPTLHKNGMADKKLIVWDHNRDLIYQRASTILNDKEAAKYVWGVGFHWYETWTGSGMNFENLKNVHEAYPDKNLVFTEGCVEKFKWDEMDNWALGERYGYSMINDFNNGTVAWTDWNILLNENGGPNHVQNFCFAPIHADTRTGELHYTNSYYYIGHFSKFVRPGAERIMSSSSRDNLLTTAFKNTDGSIAMVVMNKTDKEVTYKLVYGEKVLEAKALPHSISTLMLDQPQNL